MAHSHTPRNRCVRFVFGVTAASRNTRFQAARYDLTWAGLAPADRASFCWRLPSNDLCLSYWDDKALDERSMEGMLSTADESHVAFSAASFSGTPAPLIRTILSRFGTSDLRVA